MIIIPISVITYHDQLVLLLSKESLIVNLLKYRLAFLLRHRSALLPWHASALLFRHVLALLAGHRVALLARHFLGDCLALANRGWVAVLLWDAPKFNFSHFEVLKLKVIIIQSVRSLFIWSK